jgi:hypothetical protein
MAAGRVLGYRESFEPEFAWQVQCLASLAGQEAGKESEA